MEKGASLSKATRGMHHFVSGRSFAIHVALILLSMLVFYLLKKKKKSAEKKSTAGVSAPALISPIPTGGGSHQYAVFLSFRGSDTRKGFTDYLNHSLVNAGTIPIYVFKDDNSLPIGEKFGPRILEAITRSKISIPIISENYASSKWCLRELIRIMECKKSTSHIVLPIFYKVDPSDVRYLKGSFGKAFHSRKVYFDEKDIQEGQQALEEVSNLNGWESEKIANGREGELVKLVVETVLSKLRKDFQLLVPKELIGLDGQVKEIMNWIDSPSAKAQMIGIYGMGGIGKTTLAKCIYNQLSNKFVHTSFLPDIRESVQRHGIKSLQSQLIVDILQSQNQVFKADDGISLIKSRFKEKKVLILLDDIDHKDQLNALARESNWFMMGSMIIVTTRNEAVLDQSEFEVVYKYELNKMDELQSLLLFNRHAFRMDHSSEGFEDMTRDIISTMGGLPLALEVTGSYLYGKTNRKVWQDMLKRLRKEPHIDVQKILKISYDALEHGHQEIFLDIACFLIGKESKFAIYMWEECGFYASLGIEELKLRCLIKIGDHGELRMHDQLRDLGRNIVCQEGPLERRSRLWVHEEAFKVLMGEKGSKRIQAIRLGDYDGDPCLDDRPADHLQTYTNEQFKNLRSLRFLQLRDAALRGDFSKLFYELRWLQWVGIEPDASFLCTNLHLPKLVVLKLSYNRITEDWRGWSSIMAAERLKVLDLAFCKYLRCTPDLSTLKELEILILKKCQRLEQVHPSIGKVKTLISLDLSFCYSLKELPGEVGKLEELKELILDYAGIRKIPTSIGSMTKLEILSARSCWSLIEIPSSIGDLQNLEHLDISESRIDKLPSAIGRLKKLQRLSLKLCRSLKGEIPSEIGDLSSIKILEIIDAPMSHLPESIQNLSSLQHLSLKGCNKLESLPQLPSGLTYLNVSCQSLKLPQLSSLIHLEELCLYECNLLESIPDLPSRPLKLLIVSCHKPILPMLDRLKYLKELSIGDCKCIERLDLLELNHLKRLRVENCCSLIEIQGHYNLEFLEEILIYCCKSIKRLILPKLQCLKQLEAKYCDDLIEIRGLHRANFLEALDISNCGSIERLPNLSCLAALKELHIFNCCSLSDIESVEKVFSCQSIYIAGCESLIRLPNLSKIKNLENFTVLD